MSTYLIPGCHIVLQARENVMSWGTNTITVSVLLYYDTSDQLGVFCAVCLWLLRTSCSPICSCSCLNKYVLMMWPTWKVNVPTFSDINKSLSVVTRCSFSPHKYFGPQDQLPPPRNSSLNGMKNGWPIKCHVSQASQVREQGVTPALFPGSHPLHIIAAQGGGGAWERG